MFSFARQKLKKALFVASMIVLPVTASANIVYPGDPSWGNPPGENGGGGSSAITGTEARNGNGSLELFGDRTRFFGLGNPYDSGSNIMYLSDLQSFTFDWMIAGDSTSALHADYTPALRLHIWDDGQRSELIWEGAYNGVYGNISHGQWYGTNSDDHFWQFISGVGVTEIYDRTITDWQGIYSSGAYIAGISVGVGSSAGSDYHAFADNVRLAANQIEETFNFEVQDSVSVPAPSALLLMALGALGVVRLRRG